jgi:hypothetical protein
VSAPTPLAGHAGDDERDPPPVRRGPAATGRYSPAECIGARKDRIEGKPDMAHVSTSYSERANLTMRMHNRRFTRLTNAFSKKFENHAHMVAVYAVWYNFLRIHTTLRSTRPTGAAL